MNLYSAFAALCVAIVVGQAGLAMGCLIWCICRSSAAREREHQRSVQNWGRG